MRLHALGSTGGMDCKPISEFKARIVLFIEKGVVVFLHGMHRLRTSEQGNGGFVMLICKLYTRELVTLALSLPWTFRLMRVCTGFFLQ